MSLPPMLPGFLVFAAGFVILFALLAKHGALAKSRQIGALRDMAAGRLGPGSRRLFFVGIIALVVGTCGTFAGVAAKDAGRSRSCKKVCKERGYREAKIRGSTAMDPNNPKRHAFVACACSGGPAPDPLEMDRESLPE